MNFPNLALKSKSVVTLPIYSYFLIAKQAKSQLFEKIKNIEMLKFLLFFIYNSILSHFQPKLIEISQKICKY